MSLQAFIDQVPDYAKDVRLNLSSLLSESSNTDLIADQIAGIALASAYATRDKNLIAALEAEFSPKISETLLNASKTAAVTMGMNNVYYRYIHLAADEEIKKMRANLRMQGLQSHGIDKLDFELMSTAVSAINGCGMCMESHQAAHLKEGVSKPAIQAAIRIAAVINSAAVTSSIM